MSNLRNKKVFSTNEMEDFEKVNSYSNQARKRIMLKAILGLSLIIVGIFYGLISSTISMTILLFYSD